MPGSVYLSQCVGVPLLFTLFTQPRTLITTVQGFGPRRECADSAVKLLSQNNYVNILPVDLLPTEKIIQHRRRKHLQT